MAVPSFLQTKTYSTNTTSAAHVVTLDSAVRSAGGLISPSTLIATIGYDGAAGDIITSITDTQGNTWAKLTSATNGTTTHGEMWYAYSAKAGPTTITVNLSVPQKASIVAIEIDRVRPVSPLDLVFSRIDTTNSAARASQASTTTKRSGQMEIVIGGMAWSHATLTCSAAGSGFTQLTTIKDGSSGLGAAMVRRTADLTNITPANSIGRFTMSASGTTPCAVMSATFFRDGVVTSTSDDGYYNNIENVPSVDVAGTSGLVYRSSASAPTGGTGASEIDFMAAFFPDYSANLLPGVTISEVINFKFNLVSNYNDGIGNFYVKLKSYKSGQIGGTLDVGDYALPTPNSDYNLGDALFGAITGGQTYQISKAADYATAGLTALVLDIEGDGQGDSTSNYLEISTYEGNSPAYLVLELNYPQAVPMRSMLCVGL